MKSGSLSVKVSTLITVRRNRALAERAEAQEASASVGLPELPNSLSAAPPQRERRSFFRSLRALRRSVDDPESVAQPPVLTPASLIPTPTEGSEFSFCFGDHSSDSEGNEDDYEEVQSRLVNAADRSYQNVEPNLEDNEPGFVEENSSLETVHRVSLVPSEDMNDQVSQLCDAVKTALNSQSAAYAKKLSVVIPVFRGEECEDVQEFISNYKRAARLNGWSESNLALGLPLYLKGHASAWFKTLENPDEMSFEEISAALIRHFASGASEWRVRQALGQRRQLESESVADYSYSLRTHCARLNLPRTEWTHYFVQGLRPGIREYVVLQQPDTLEAAENFAKLKESVLATSDKTPTLDVKQVSAKIVEEISKSVVPKEKAVSAVNQQGSDCNKSDIRRMIRAEIQQAMNTNSPSQNAYRQRINPNVPVRGFRTRSGNPVCFNCGRQGHTYYNCRASPDPRVPRYSRGRQNHFSGQRQNQNNFSWNAKQGN